MAASEDQPRVMQLNCPGADGEKGERLLGS